MGQNNLVQFIKSSLSFTMFKFHIHLQSRADCVVTVVSLKNYAIKFGRLTAQRHCSRQENQLFHDQYSDLNYSV